MYMLFVCAPYWFLWSCVLGLMDDDLFRGIRNLRSHLSRIRALNEDTQGGLTPRTLVECDAEFAPSIVGKLQAPHNRYMDWSELDVYNEYFWCARRCQNWPVVGGVYYIGWKLAVIAHLYSNEESEEWAQAGPRPSNCTGIDWFSSGRAIWILHVQHAKEQRP